MNYNRKTDLNQSSAAFESITGTTLQKLIKGDIMSCEAHTDDINSLGFVMDVYSGIDYLSINEHGVRGLAVRCQFGAAYNTFTIRYKRSSGSKTEYEKRQYQIKNGYICPEFTIQAYFDNKVNKNLISIAIVRTVDLYQVISDSNDITTKHSNNEFIVIHWSKIPKDKIKIWQRPSNIDITKIKR